MDEFLKPETIKLLSQAVLPGVVIVYVRGQLLPNRRLELKDAIVGYVALSVLYQALLGLAAEVPWPMPGVVPAPIFSISISMIFPALLGLWLGLDGSFGWSRLALQRLGIHLSHPVNSAWDWRFSACEECWIMATLKDGTRWQGHLSPNSFTSTDPTERDIFIEQVYNLEDDNTWTAKGSSVLIAQGEIQTLEFWPLKSVASSS